MANLRLIQPIFQLRIIKKVKSLAEKPRNPIFASRLKIGRFVYRLGQPPFTGQRRVRFPYRLQTPLQRSWRGVLHLETTQACLRALTNGERPQRRSRC